jgi:hypothetical protein
MAHIVIQIISLTPNGENNNDIFVGGEIRTSDMEAEDVNLTFQALIDSSSLATVQTAVIKAAAIEVAENAGHTIGLLDKKTLYGGGVGL